MLPTLCHLGGSKDKIVLGSKSGISTFFYYSDQFFMKLPKLSKKVLPTLRRGSSMWLKVIVGPENVPDMNIFLI